MQKSLGLRNAFFPKDKNEEIALLGKDLREQEGINAAPGDLLRRVYEVEQAGTVAPPENDEVGKSSAEVENIGENDYGKAVLSQITKSPPSDFKNWGEAQDKTTKSQLPGNKISRP